MVLLLCMSHVKLTGTAVDHRAYKNYIEQHRRKKIQFCSYATIGQVCKGTTRLLENTELYSEKDPYKQEKEGNLLKGIVNWWDPTGMGLYLLIRSHRRT